MSCKDCLDRRAFLIRSAVSAAVLVAVDGCGDGQIGPSVPRSQSGGGDPLLPPGGPVTVVLADFPALATEGALVAIDPFRALVRTGPTTFRGLSRICTHQQCVTSVRDDRLECPCHGSIFAADGAVIRGPNIASPPIVPVRTLTATFDPDAQTITVA